MLQGRSNGYAAGGVPDARCAVNTPGEDAGALSVEAAFLASYLAWRRGDVSRAHAFATRALQAARSEVPTRGVLGEGDRKPTLDAAHKAPPPLANPMGRMLFSELVAAACARDASAAGLERAWRALQRSESDYARRAAASLQR